MAAGPGARLGFVPLLLPHLCSYTLFPSDGERLRRPGSFTCWFGLQASSLPGGGRMYSQRSGVINWLVLMQGQGGSTGTTVSRVQGPCALQGQGADSAQLRGHPTASFPLGPYSRLGTRQGWENWLAGGMSRGHGSLWGPGSSGGLSEGRPGL